ncbi:response regulator transcription factor [Anaerosphaera multitolerans]|uniref:DNA-binding response regulator n=1 Tax=Anaerosphaera multitolerans TaxID=2487351 RepID=A0A437S5P3_9FIRM|nr:response regulator transcription factor [Anaerosphaera multitolerans]RVU54362.1 DNA-binding response regulator [Anaerosphaera multitolerans]
MKLKKKILIIEDDPSITQILILNLKGHYEVITAENGTLGFDKLISERADLILLDLGLPDMDGMDLLAKIKKDFDTPLIVVSARQTEKDIVEALDLGANDYVVKPFGTEELLARIRRSLRHYSPEKRTYEVGDFAIDFDKRQVSMKGNQIHLTPIEYGIVAFLSSKPGKVLTHNQIINKVWGPYESDNQILRVNMANIRRKIEKNPATPTYFITDAGIGYKIIDENDIK